MEAPPRSPRILIADDHPLMRSDLRRNLEKKGLEVCAEAPTGSDAVTAALRERPDLCLLDVRMPGGDASRPPWRSAASHPPQRSC
jgi:DNA-binding NarL/FixJ family response regulator